MIASKAKHPNCMYKWMNHIIAPKAQRRRSPSGSARRPPTRRRATLDRGQGLTATIFHADDEAYFDKVYYWTTPSPDCGDDRGDVCKDYADWVQAWTEIKG